MRKPKNANKQKGLKILGIKKAKKGQYVQENMEKLARKVFEFRNTRDKGVTLLRVNVEELEKVIKTLPKEKRESIEKFCGLTGGPNHSQKTNVASADRALINLRNSAESAIMMLYELDKMYIYDESLKIAVAQLAKKINKGKLQISDLDAVKYLIVFLVVLENGPKMSFEEDSLAIDTSVREDSIFDEYSVIYAACRELNKLSDKSINLEIIKSWIESIDFNDSIILKKSFQIDIPDISHLKQIEQMLHVMPQFKGKEIFPTNEHLKEFNPIRRLSEVRKFKERIFPYGAWEVTREFILGITDGVNLEKFGEKLSQLSKDWLQIQNFKIGQEKIRTSYGIRNLDVYSIEGLKFTDPYEIMFLYWEGNSIFFKNKT